MQTIRFITKLKQIFCKHEFEVNEMKNQYVNYDGLDFSDTFKIISIKCSRCGKIKRK